MIADGLRLFSAEGVEAIAWPRLVVDPRAVEDRFDIILLTVKAYAVRDALAAVTMLLAESGIVVSFQNGVGTDELLLDRFGADRVVAGTLTLSVGIDRPGMVKQYSRNGGIAWSTYRGGGNANFLTSVFERTGLPVARIASPASLKWSKLLLNSVGSAQCAILQMDLVSIVEDHRLFRIEQRAFRETLGVMKLAGISVVDLPAYPVRLAAGLMRLPSPAARLALGRRMARGRGGKAPTLRGDVARGGPTENAYLNRATAELGQSLGVPTPVNLRLADLVDEVTRSAEARRAFCHNGRALVEAIVGASS